MSNWQEEEGRLWEQMHAEADRKAMIVVIAFIALALFFFAVKVWGGGPPPVDGNRTVHKVCKLADGSARADIEALPGCCVEIDWTQPGCLTATASASYSSFPGWGRWVAGERVNMRLRITKDGEPFGQSGWGDLEGPHAAAGPVGDTITVACTDEVERRKRSAAPVRYCAEPGWWANNTRRLIAVRGTLTLLYTPHPESAADLDCSVAP